MNRIRKMAVEVGPVEAGWSSFTVQIDDSSWTCQASNIGEHPVCALIRTVADMHAQLFDRYVRSDTDPYYRNEVVACAEPGGIVLTFMPQRKVAIEVAIYRVHEDILWPTMEKLGNRPPDRRGLISFWQLVDAVYSAAAEMIRRHGFTGFHERWHYSWWTEQQDSTLFPFEHFIFLAMLKRSRRPHEKFGWPLADEIGVLQEILLQGHRPCPPPGSLRSQRA